MRSRSRRGGGGSVVYLVLVVEVVVVVVVSVVVVAAAAATTLSVATVFGVGTTAGFYRKCTGGRRRGGAWDKKDRRAGGAADSPLLPARRKRFGRLRRRPCIGRLRDSLLLPVNVAVPGGGGRVCVCARRARRRRNAVFRQPNACCTFRVLQGRRPDQPKWAVLLHSDALCSDAPTGGRNDFEINLLPIRLIIYFYFD